MLRLLVSGALAAAAVSLSPALAVGAEFKATIVAGHPPIFPWVKLFTEVMIPETNKALEGTGHTIVWTEGYGGSIAAVGGEAAAIEDGLAQIGTVSTVFAPAQFPLQNVSYVVPFGSADAALVLSIVDDLHKTIPAMRKLWEDRNMEYVYSAVGVDDYVLMTKKPLASFADLNGLKIGAPGPAVNWLKGTGAVGVSGNLTTYYNDLQTGVIDGAIVFATAAAPAKLFEQAKYVTKARLGAQYSGATIVNKEWFDSLPPEVKAAVTKGLQAYASGYMANLQARLDAAMKAMEAGGAVISELPEAERAKWAAALPNLPMEWAKDQDAKGLPGTDVLAAFLDGLRKAGTTLPRDWQAK